MALPLVLYDVTATIAKAPATRGPSHPLRIASCPGLGVRAQCQTPPVRGSVCVTENGRAAVCRSLLQGQ
jgi:hypothetical protein